MTRSFTLWVSFFVGISVFAQSGKLNAGKVGLFNTRLSQIENPVEKNRMFRQVIQMNALKSSQIQSERMDSLITEPVNSSESKYMQVFGYNSNGQTKDILYYEWYSNDQSWVVNQSISLGYDASDKLVSGVMTITDDFGSTFTNDYKIEFTYTAANAFAEITEYIWASASEAWEVSWKNSMVYDESGLMTYDVEYFYSGGDLESADSTVYTYNEDNTLTELVVYTMEGIEYAPKTKVSYTVDRDGYTTAGMQYTYANNAWAPEYQYEYTYDEKGNPTQEDILTWDGASEVFVQDEKVQYSYDILTNYSDLIAPDYYFLDAMYSDKIVSKPLIGNHYYFDGDETWTSEAVLTYCYTDLKTATATKEVSFDGTLVYPNPVKDQLTIQWEGGNDVASLTVFSLSGVEVISKTVMNGEQVSMVGQKAGIYMYRLQTEGAAISGKFVKE